MTRCSCSYYSSVYFRFFAPLYALSLLLDHLRHVLAVKELASFYLFVLEKQDPQLDAIERRARSAATPNGEVAVGALPPLGE